jgi:hypothetical protein
MCEIGINFSNINYYNKEMQKGMDDKLFFLNKLPKNQHYIFVDFGCADGSMINTLSSILESDEFKNMHIPNDYIGYDISENMINIAKTNYHGPIDAKVDFTNKWYDVQHILELNEQYNHNAKSVLILSSVIHEVYSYAKTQGDILDFWDKVLQSNFDYIVIRDMCPSETLSDKKEISVELHDKLIYRKNLRGNDKSYDHQVETFEAAHGSLWYEKNMYHFLLKYRWKINWAREYNENYFPISYQELLNIVKTQPVNCSYNIDYFERFRVPFLDKCIKEDFDIELSEFTHIKAIFTKIN